MLTRNYVGIMNQPQGNTGPYTIYVINTSMGGMVLTTYSLNENDYFDQDLYDDPNVGGSYELIDYPDAVQMSGGGALVPYTLDETYSETYPKFFMPAGDVDILVRQT